MAYYDVFLLTQDSDFQGRVSACYATESGVENPGAWTAEHIWLLASAPGFGDAYASALAAGKEKPGSLPDVITDAMILSAVQFLVGKDAEALAAQQAASQPPASGLEDQVHSQGQDEG